ncbi:hypothetical protein EV421DRAFT_875089 [Armillaria borealis]|uniref:Uncharacterized protein n=1 Tax=Armillaria borealis TaxID=47425 RepID=A0AA39JEM7_9AGAR|nr:hypothetical protein EV421DRAFT_875089 [Armillaria borealis]
MASAMLSINMLKMDRDVQFSWTYCLRDARKMRYLLLISVLQNCWDVKNALAFGIGSHFSSSQFHVSRFPKSVPIFWLSKNLKQTGRKGGSLFYYPVVLLNRRTRSSKSIHFGTKRRLFTFCFIRFFDACTSVTARYLLSPMTSPRISILASENIQGDNYKIFKERNRTRSLMANIADNRQSLVCQDRELQRDDSDGMTRLLNVEPPYLKGFTGS